MENGKVTHDPEEIIAVVNERDEIIDTLPRQHFTPDLIRRLVYVLVVNDQDQILVQERTDNGRLTASASGHFPHDETYLQGAQREASEELGVEFPAEDFVFVKKFYLGAENEHIPSTEFKRFTGVYKVMSNLKAEDFPVDPAEVKSVAYYDVATLKEMIQANPDKFTSGFKHVMEHWT